MQSLKQGCLLGICIQNQGPHPLGPKEIDGLLVPPDKVFTLLTDHLITVQFLNLPKKSGSSETIKHIIPNQKSILALLINGEFEMFTNIIMYGHQFQRVSKLYQVNFSVSLDKFLDFRCCIFPIGTLLHISKQQINCYVT